MPHYYNMVFRSMNFDYNYNYMMIFVSHCCVIACISVSILRMTYRRSSVL